MKKTGILIIGFISIFQIGFSQIIDFKMDKYWIDAGVGGYYLIDHTGGFSWNLGVNLISDNTLYKLRFLNHKEFNIFGPNPSEEFNSVGMMIGKGFTGKYIQILFSGGLGVTGGIKRGKLLYTEPSSGWFDIGDRRHFENERFISPSIPLEIDLLIKPIKYLGAGVSLFGDLNLKRPMYGFVFKFGLGKIR